MQIAFCGFIMGKVGAVRFVKCFLLPRLLLSVLLVDVAVA